MMHTSERLLDPNFGFSIEAWERVEVILQRINMGRWDISWKSLDCRKEEAMRWEIHNLSSRGTMERTDPSMHRGNALMRGAR